MRLLLFFWLVSLTAHAQLTLRGRVLNDTDGQPVPFCSVFLANTTKGTTADSTGNFVLTNLPPGRYDLVASSVGFETVAAPMNTDQTARLEIRLRPVANQLAEVQVRASRDPEWLNSLATFRKFFVGTSKNAQECQIVNQNKLWFDDDRQAMKLTAGAREPLILENRALGYRIRYSLTQFLFDYARQYVSYLGYPVYEDLKPRSRREAVRWAKARQEAYLGSAMHFMRALHKRKVTEEGYVLRRVLERADSTKIGGKWQVKKSRYVVNDPMPATLLINQDASSDSLTVLAFENLMQVTYTREKESTEYLNSLAVLGSSTATRGPQTSMIYLTQPYVLVEKNGNFYDQLGVVFEGYWGWEKMAELLPLTYAP